jgi:hypothetical protein
MVRPDWPHTWAGYRGLFDIGILQSLIERQGDFTQWLIDPSTVSYHGVHRAVVFHSCAAR